VGAVGVVAYRALGGGSLSSTVVPIVMHDEAALSTRHHVNKTMGFRIRLPKSQSTQTKTGPSSIPGAEQEFMARVGERSVGVVISDRKSASFDRFVAMNRVGLRSTKDLADLKILDEGRCNVGGMDAYELTISCVANGTRVRQRQIYVNVPGNKVYLLQATSKESEWSANSDVFDSCFSTFEIGQFAEDPPETPPALARGGNPGVPGVPATRMPPQPPAMRQTFDKPAEALQVLQTGKPEERRAALSFLERTPPDPTLRTQVVPAVLKLMSDDALRYSANTTLKAWATKDDASLLRGELERLLQQDSGSTVRDLESRKTLIKILGDIKDAASAQPIAKCLRNIFVRDETKAALTALGADAEEAVLELLGDRDGGVVREALNMLAAMGSEKSLMPLQRLAGGRDTSLATEADDVLKKLAARLKWSPEQYLYNLVNHYTIEAPTGFAADASVPANTRQWTRAASGRSVKSVYTVAVRLVPADYRPQYASANPQILEAGTIVFKQLANAGATPQFTRSVKYAAVDGEYLIELTATMDTADTAAGTNMTNAAKKIRAKP
jgi:hypothetical protein